MAKKTLLPSRMNSLPTNEAFSSRTSRSFPFPLLLLFYHLDLSISLSLNRDLSFSNSLRFEGSEEYEFFEMWMLFFYWRFLSLFLSCQTLHKEKKSQNLLVLKFLGLFFSCGFYYFSRFMGLICWRIRWRKGILNEFCMFICWENVIKEKKILIILIFWATFMFFPEEHEEHVTLFFRK